MTIKNIELNPIEATAYFWINTIKNKVKELSSISNKSNNELEFFNLFKQYTDFEWRKLYLVMKDYFNNKINSNHFYIQDTSVHNDINKVLNNVLNREIPDIDLALNGIEDYFTCTNIYGADRIYKESGIIQIESTYSFNYILSGDINELELNTLMILLLKKFKKNHSKKLLKNLFCDIYKELHTELELSIIEDNFIRIYNQICDLGLIVDLSFNNQYNSNISDSEYKYLDTNNELSKIIKKVKLVVSN